MVKQAARKEIFGWAPEGLVERAQSVRSVKVDQPGTVHLIGAEVKPEAFAAKLKGLVPAWQIERLKKGDKDLYAFSGSEGPFWAVVLKKNNEKSATYDLFPLAPYAKARNAAGPLMVAIEQSQQKALTIVGDGASAEEKLGFLVGLEIANYRYLKTIKPPKDGGLKIALQGFPEKIQEEAAATGQAVNLARHLVNTPPNLLNPETYAEQAKALFSGMTGMKAEIWDRKRIEKEQMGLLMGVGGGAVHGPTMLHLRYRPTGATKKKPLAFVGKGITFDSGGLDIKPSSAMRLMKKDMGGSASVLGLAWYVATRKLKVACDFYLPMAENMVDQHSFRPGDVLVSRQGMSVEIDNTDAEGRLILADALDVAVSQTGANEPEAVINVATLTGAARVALGTEVGALFSTSDKLAQKVCAAGERTGDLVWRMPLVQSYEGSLSSQFADTNHCATSGFGGAITAALFLRKFVGEKPWVHLDVMAWTDAKGAYRETGGNGQTVQCLIDFLRQT